MSDNISANVTEEELISLAIVSNRRKQFFTRLANERTRRKLLKCLNHVAPLDPRWTTYYSSLYDAVSAVNVPPNLPVYLISDDVELDAKTLPFSDAIEALKYSGWGTIIGITPELAIYCDEQETHNAAVICRKS